MGLSLPFLKTQRPKLLSGSMTTHFHVDHAPAQQVGRLTNGTAVKIHQRQDQAVFRGELRKRPVQHL